MDETLFFSPASRYFPDGNLYHGTRTPESFRSILFQGILPSEDGSAGAGLYGVGHDNLKFAEEWGRDPDRVVRFTVAPSARLVDVTKGEGERIWNEYKAHHPGATLEKFAEDFGIDIIAYPYDPPAFVVKNSDVLSAPVGHRVQLMTLSELIARAGTVDSEEALTDFMRTVRLNRPPIRELRLILSTIQAKSKSPDVREAAEGVISLLDGKYRPFRFLSAALPPLAADYPSIAEALGHLVLPPLLAANDSMLDGFVEALVNEAPQTLAMHWFDEMAKKGTAAIDRLWDRMDGIHRAEALFAMKDLERPSPAHLHFMGHGLATTSPGILSALDLDTVAEKVIPYLARDGEEAFFEWMRKNVKPERHDWIVGLVGYASHLHPVHEALLPWAVKHPDAKFRRALTHANLEVLRLGHRPSEALVKLTTELALSLIDDPDKWVRRDVVLGMNRLRERGKLPKTPEMLSLVLRRLDDPEKEVRREAMEILTGGGRSDYDQPYFISRDIDTSFGKLMLEQFARMDPEIEHIKRIRWVIAYTKHYSENAIRFIAAGPQGPDELAYLRGVPAHFRDCLEAARRLAD